MFTWITANLGTIVVSIILIALVTAVIFKMIKDKKNGITSCGGNCAHCGMCASCQRPEKKIQIEKEASQKRVTD